MIRREQIKKEGIYMKLLKTITATMALGGMFAMTANTEAHATSFVDTYAPSAQTLANQMNLYPSVMLAQMALESNFGTSGLTKDANNLFGIKGSYKGKSIRLKTSEYHEGKYVTVHDHFRAYPSYWASMVDYTMVMQGRHFSGAWVSNTSSYKQATQALEGVYATDHRYSEKLNNIIAQYNLTRYDRKISVKASVKSVKTTSSNRVTHTVKRGESLSTIAVKYGVSERNIAARSGLNNKNHLVVGQKLIIR